MRNPYIYILIICALFINLQKGFSQNERANKIVFRTQLNQIDIKAIIVGVSEYKNLPECKQLLFADDDADEFCNFLDTIGIKKENITKVINDQASSAYVEQLLYNTLFKNSKAGDILLFYFAGHGDVDAEIGDGFLLMSEVTDDGDYSVSDAIELNWIQRRVATAGKKGVVTVLITDACRSGKLIRDPMGAFNTTTALVKDWESALKLVSCQPEQYSYEGERWGGGHGIFTFYLINGLMGLADEDNDGVIRFGEIADYVRQNVRNETEYKQTPKSSGNDGQNLFLVDTVLKKNAKAIIEEHIRRSVTPVQGRGLNPDTLNIDKETLILIDSLRSAILFNNLIDTSQYFITEDKSKISLSKVISLKGHDNRINDICISPDKIFTCSDDCKIKIWDIKDLSLIQVIDKMKAPVLSIGYIGENMIVSGGKDNTITIWDIQKNKLVRKIKKAHNSCVNNIIIRKDANQIISSGDDDKIHIWSAETGKLLVTLEGNINNFTSLQINPDGNLLTAGDAGGVIYIWNLKDYELAGTLSGPKYPVTGIIFHENRKILISCYNSGQISLWNVDNHKLIKTFTTERNSNLSCIVKNNHLLILTKKDILKHIFFDTGGETNINIEQKNISKILSVGDSLIVCGNETGELLLERVDYPHLIPSAMNLFQQLEDIAIPDKTILELKGELYSALVNKADETVIPFILGDYILPDKKEVEYAIELLDNAILLFNTDTLLIRKTTFKKYILQINHILYYDNKDDNKYKYAIHILDSIAEIEPNSAFPFHLLGILYQRLDSIEKAKENIQHAINNSKTWTEPRNNLGNIYLDNSQYDKAINEYEKIINIKPDSPKAYNNLGKVHFKLGSYQKAEDFYKKSLLIDSVNPVTIINYGELQLFRGRYRDAENLLLKSYEIDSSFYLSVLQNAKLLDFLYTNDLQDEEYIKQALYLYRKAIKIYPENPEIYISLAKFYIKAIDKDDKTMNKVLFNSPVFLNENEDLKRKLIDEIIKLSNKALTIDPNSIDAIECLAFASLFRNEYFDDAYIKEIRVNSELPWSYYKYALKKKKKGDFMNAIINYKTAIDKDNLFLLAYLNLWDVYVVLNQTNELNMLYKKALKVFPESPVFPYRKAILDKKVDESELKKAISKDKQFYQAKLLLYNNNYKIGSKSTIEIEDQQYKYSIKKVEKLNDKCFLVTKDNWYGVMEITGKFILPLDYNKIIKINDTLICAISGDEILSQTNKILWFGMNGKLYKFQEYKRAFLRCNGKSQIDGCCYFVVEKDGKYGCIDLFGQEIIPVTYQNIINFSNGNSMVGVMSGNKFGCYSMEGQLIIPIQYDRIEQGFLNQDKPCVVCYLNDKKFWIDITGKQY
ncbi:MAG: tetratricopeptide repeat protein [Bacteroidia bacterium]|nr:tetratricopeptide repeat protein [Bacteroidia bacterium]